MTTHKLARETIAIYPLGDDEKTAIRQSAVLIGKHLGDVTAELISELLLAIMSTRVQVAPSLNNSILTASEVADVLRISKSKIYRMIQQGELPAVKFGRTARIKQQDLEDFIQRQLVE